MLHQNSVTQIGNFSYYPSQIIGQGATSIVYKGFRNQDKLPIAVKTIRLKQISTPVKKHLLDCEVAALRAIRNRYICQVFDILQDPEYYFIPLQYCPQGTLRDYIKKKGVLNQYQTAQIFYKIVEGYCAIRKASFMHRDLKSQNILLRPNYQPVIIDFGYCQRIETQAQRLPYNVGSPAYMAPESYLDSIYSEKSDIWALGVILHEMLTGDIPTMRTDDIDKYFQYLSKMKTAQIRPQIKNPVFLKILRSTLSIPIQFRPTAQQLKTMLMPLINLQNPIRERGQSSFNKPPKSARGQNISYPTPLKIVTSPQINNGNQIFINKKTSIDNTSDLSKYSSSKNSHKYYQNISGSPMLVPPQNLQNQQNQQNQVAFGNNLRKRVLTCNNFNVNFNFNQTTPIRQQYTQSPYSPQIHNVQKNQKITSAQFITFNKQADSYPPMKKNYSANSLNNIIFAQPH